MPKYIVFARETVYYMKEVEAESYEQAEQMVKSGDVYFEYGDITDGDNFQIDEIEEEKRYA
jgi:hypothetical protein